MVHVVLSKRRRKFISSVILESCHESRWNEQSGWIMTILCHVGWWSWQSRTLALPSSGTMGWSSTCSQNMLQVVTLCTLPWLKIMATSTTILFTLRFTCVQNVILNLAETYVGPLVKICYGSLIATHTFEISVIALVWSPVERLKHTIINKFLSHATMLSVHTGVHNWFIFVCIAFSAPIDRNIFTQSVSSLSRFYTKTSSFVNYFLLLL